VRAWRIVLAAAGILLVVFGAARLLTEIPVRNLLFLGAWLVAALAIHDGILSPAVVGAGWLLRRFVPDRGRRYLQIALIMSGVVTVIALPMIYLQGSQPAVKAILLRDYTANLGLLVGLIGLVTLGLYAERVARDRSASDARRARSGLPQT
jgi:hypothetical protein